MKLSTVAAAIGAVAEAALAAPITLGAEPSLVQPARIAAVANRPIAPSFAEFINISSPSWPRTAPTRYRPYGV